MEIWIRTVVSELVVGAGEQDKFAIFEKKNINFCDCFSFFTGFLFGVFDCILGRSHRHSIIAARSSQLCFIPSEVIKAIKNRFPTVQVKLRHCEKATKF